MYSGISTLLSLVAKGVESNVDLDTVMVGFWRGDSSAVKSKVLGKGELNNGLGLSLDFLTADLDLVHFGAMSSVGGILRLIALIRGSSSSLESILLLLGSVISPSSVSSG